ncbi:hypothetical protein [Psychroserpens sp. MEBiC05023]
MSFNHINLFILFLFSNAALAQETKSYTYDSFAEKIYLQLDNEVYTTDKTIWFKAIVSNAVLHSPEFSSGVLYVDLINPKKDIVKSKIIKIEEGIGNGFFDLDRSYDEGQYILRAYTEWNKNFGSDFFFKKDIQIYSENSKYPSLKPVQNLRRTDSSSSGFNLKADIFPEHIDSLHKNQKLRVVVIQDGVRDTIKLKRGRNGFFDFSHLIKKNTKEVTLELITHDKKHYLTTLLKNRESIDLQFFPESGSLVHGLTSKVGFKAIDPNGKGTGVKGVILDNHDRIVTAFESNVLGMGHFFLKDVDSSLTYKARCFGVKDSIDWQVNLPKVKGNGILMAASFNENAINISVASNDSKNDQSIILKASCRGYTYFHESGRIVNGSFVFSIPKQSLPEGIIVFRLSDNDNFPIAERMIFNEMPTNRITIKAIANKKEYQQREKVNLKVEAVNSENIPLVVSLSSLVVQKEQFNDVQNLRENILSFFLLSSDLKGTIETPGAYFNNEEQLNIDDLLLTQGWSNYKYIKLSGNFNFEMEQKLKVSGIINHKKKVKSTEELELMLMTFDEMKVPYIKNVNVPGTFNFELDDMYGSEKDILIQPINGSKDERKKYVIALNEKKRLPISFNSTPKHKIVINEEIADKIVSQNRKYKKEETDFYFSTFGRTILDEVVIDGYKMTPKRQEMLNTYGKPDVVIDGEEIVEKTSDWSYGLYSVLRNSFWDKITILRQGRDLRAQIFTNEVTLVVIDGIPVLEHEYPFVQYLSPDEIVSFEVIKFPKNFNALYTRVFPLARPPFPDGSIISIYTKIGKGIFGALEPAKDRLELNSISVFAQEKEFYVPKYDNDDFNSNTLDLRTPLYWNPEITTDDQGRALIDYYNSDVKGDFIIILEAITNSGMLGYKVVPYKVKERLN